MTDKSSDSKGSTDTTATRPFRVMIADDEKAVRTLLSRMLKKEGFQVITAVDGDEAWQRMRNHDIDLLITDVRMPGRSGDDLLRTLRDEQPSVPVVLMTGMPDIEAAVVFAEQSPYPSVDTILEDVYA